MQWRKSATWPSCPVSRPSSNTCRKRSQTAACAFSNSSSSTTENGCLRTRLMSESRCRLAAAEDLVRRSPASGTRSCRGGSCGRPSRTGTRRRVLASSVLPVPVGPANRKTPIGLPGSFRPALSMAMRSTMAATASSWPITRLGEIVADEARSTRSLLSRIEAGRPVSWDSVTITSPAAIVAPPPLATRLARELDEVEHRAREARRAQILPRRAERDRHAGRIDRPRRSPSASCAKAPAPARRSPPAPSAPAAPPRRGCAAPAADCSRRAVLADDASVHTISRPADDGRQDLVEDARRLALVRAAQRHLQDVGDVPDELLGRRQLLDRALDAPLELAEPLLARHQVGAAGLEHGPALFLEAPRRAAAGTTSCRRDARR